MLMTVHKSGGTLVNSEFYLITVILGTSMISFVKGKTEISLNLPD